MCCRSREGAVVVCGGRAQAHHYVHSVVPRAQHQPALRVSLCLCLLQACAMPWTCALHPVAGARWDFCGGGEG